jgi:hypothetical protein
MNKLRIRPHGKFNTWWCIQERRFFVWITLCQYIENRAEAEAEVAAIIASDANL